MANCISSDTSRDSNDDSSTKNTDKKDVLLSFIENYRELPILWDVTLKQYSDKNKRNQAYEKLLAIYKQINKNATIQDVKRKINSLRTNYRKERKKVEGSQKSGAGTDEIYEPKCWTFKELSFLNESSVSYVAPSVSSENPQVSENI